ncbi:undecaprenyl-diphosphate phosphatase [Halomarina salina]|uniref:Undecaprenyl-diphosphatase n=1 Tax=Halomarina salina TaxID=1872699 RepID=A0ABD5RPB7_9EURY|nr:undecaprenyl-diphosphate phosphatase [Halomarina salina]
MNRSLVVALVVGLLQGVFEWLPVSSEGQVTLYLTVVEGVPATTAARFSLFLHAGTALSALAYYRGTVRGTLADAVGWRPTSRRPSGWRPTQALDWSPERRFLVAATLVSALVGGAAYLAFDALVDAVTGGVFVALVGLALVGTGLFQRFAGRAVERRTAPTLVDAVLVGSLQGVAVLPGVSRSGTTTGALLLRGHDASESFRLSFLLSIPAAFGAGALVVLTEGVLALSPASALVALAASAVVGYLTIDALVRVAERASFWWVCVGLGLLAVVGGLFVPA